MFPNLNIGGKLVLLGLVLSLPIAVLLFLLVKEQNIAIDFGENERRGVEYIDAVRHLLHDIQKHQVAFLTGGAQAAALEKQIEEDIRSAQEVDGRYGKELKTNHGLAGLVEKWSTRKPLILRSSAMLNRRLPRTSFLTPTSTVTTRWTTLSSICPSLGN
ncbi:MAG: hypothetical protein ABI988_16120 [Nitrospirota bacterium]